MLAEETRGLVRQWRQEDGQDDPLDRLTETYWDYPTLHEVLEREAWHTTQHVRQLEYVLQRNGIAPARHLARRVLGDLMRPLPGHGPLIAELARDRLNAGIGKVR